jgi:hypothetical protein
MDIEIDKHHAIELAITLNAPGETRVYLIALIQGAYQHLASMRRDVLCHRLQYLSRKDDAEKLLDVLHFMLCLRLNDPVS